MPHDAEICSLIRQTCVDHERELKAFLQGTLRNPHLVEDAFQKTVVRAIDSDASPNPESVRGWLFRIALNIARDLKRAQKREQKHHQNFARQPGTGGVAPVSDGMTELLRREESERIEQALQQLKPEYREVVIRRIREGQTFAEIAEELNRPLGTILTWMRRALADLRAMQVIRGLSEDRQEQ